MGKRREQGRRSLFGVTLAIAAAGCIVDEIEVTPEVMPALVQSGETREVTLRFIRLDVEGLNQSLTFDDLAALPPATLEDIWLLDFEPSNVLLTVLGDLKGLSTEEASALPQAAQNMRTLLRMTPDNADLTGTKLEEAIDLAQSVNIPPARVLADLTEVGITEELLSPDIASVAIMENLIASHPNAQFRKGPVDAEHPDGLYPVKPGLVPVTLADVANNLETLLDRFGPVPLDPADPNSPIHPGFITGVSGVTAAEDDFTMTVKASLNAMPYEGLDGSYGSVHYLNSIPSQIETMFDFDDPDWMQVTGLLDVIHVEEMTMSITESDLFWLGGSSMEPEGQGNSEAWGLPQWEFERILLEMAKIKALGHPERGIAGVSDHCTSYPLGQTIGFKACIGISALTPEDGEPPPPDGVPVVPGGWTELRSVADLGDPPAPSYLWDVLLEVVEVRLHDGGLAEGEGDVEFTLHDVEIPLDPAAVLTEIKANAKADPRVLTDLAIKLNDTSAGDPDFYYYRPRLESSPEVQGDYLYFIAPVDVRRDEDNEPVRPYSYAAPGFFRDEALTDKASSITTIDDDDVHEKVKVEVGTVLYFEDDAQTRFRVAVTDKPELNSIKLELTRLN